MALEIGTVTFRDLECVVLKGMYASGQIKLWLITARTRAQMGTATVHMPVQSVPKGHVLIRDYSENEGILQALVEGGIVSKPVNVVTVGPNSLQECQLLVGSGKKGR